MIFNGPSEEYFRLSKVHSEKCIDYKTELESPLTFLWFQKNDSLVIDGVRKTFSPNEIVCLTEFHKVENHEGCSAKMIRFNRSFYCVIDHDSAIGCKGILFFGASQLPVLKIMPEEIEKFQTIWKMFEIEMKSNDEMQLEMLQTMLKRFIILCTRVYKQQKNYNTIQTKEIDIVREYNFLVEKHFKTKHTVAEYADLLFKSPKTLSNLFAKLADKTPLQYIQDRKMLEAKRLLTHSAKSVKEIAFEVGFEDLQSFGRFFKNYAGMSPSKYKQT